MGTGPQDMKTARFVKRVLSVSDDGWHYEADPVHAKAIVEHMGLHGSTPAPTSATQYTEKQLAEATDQDAGDIAKFRTVTGIDQFLAADRDDIRSPSSRS